MESNRQLAPLRESVLARVEIDPRLLMAAKAIQLMSGKNDDGTPKISDEMAIAAALYQAGTGQLVGRDFYVNDKVGRMEGYRGAARDAANRGAGELQIDYRPLTAAENAENEVKPCDVAYACEVYQLRAWRMAQKMGQPYKPITGVGVLREVEKYTNTDDWKESSSGKKYKAGLKPREQWRPITLEGGMTWAKKAKNRAYKDALRHVPGAPATVEEVLEEGALSGAEMPPEGARMGVDQAVEWVRQNAAATDGEYRQVSPEEQAATLQANVARMRGPGGNDPLGIDEQPRQVQRQPTPQEVRKPAAPAPEPPPDNGHEADAEIPMKSAEELRAIAAAADAQFEAMQSARAERAAAAPKPQPPANPAQKLAVIKSVGWALQALNLAKRQPYYQNKRGEADYGHMAASALKLGYPEIVDGNLVEVIAALEDHALAAAHEKQDA